MNAKLVSVAKIWDAAPHNAFTDLVRFKDKWFCTFREATGHVSGDGKARVIASADGAVWSSVALIERSGCDLRDSKFCITPDNRLMMTVCRVSAKSYQSLTLFSGDGVEWSNETEVADPGFWLWRVTWNKKRAYGAGYGCADTNKFIRIYASDDGRKFTALSANAYNRGYPNESTMVFLPDDTCLCVTRRDEDSKTAMLGKSKPPYADWAWSDLGRHIGGPNLLRLPDGRIVAGGRTEWGQTALHWLNPDAGALTEFLQLPSGGDASYPGLVWRNDLLWVSYYSSHEQKTSIYLAKIELPAR